MSTPELKPSTPKLKVCGPQDIRIIDPKEVPDAAAAYFVLESRNLTEQPALQLENFDQLMAIDFADSHTTYFAQHDKTYFQSSLAGGDTERLIYVADIDSSGRGVGSGEIRYSLTRIDPYFYKKPFVGNTRTNPSHQREGLGRRRLLAMNAASLLVHNLVLHSDTLRQPAASMVWKKLVRQGLAEQYYEPASSPDHPGNSRYRFLPASN